MELMAKEERFEEAAFYRDQFETLKNNPVFDTKSLQKVSNLDVVGFASSKNRVQIIILFIRGGYIIDKADLFFTSKTKQLEIEIYQLISQFYSKQISTPDGILLSNEFQYLTELKEDLLAIGLKKINIQIPKKGKKNKLIELAKNNAEDHIKNNIKSEKETNLTLTKIYNQPPLIAEEIINEFNDYKDIVSNHVVDTSLLIDNAIKDQKSILFEGAQGTLLDIDHGTYPFVTSSNTSSGNAAIGSGVGPKNIDRIVGVTKAYISRVGSGPFVTEQKNEIGDYLIEKGAEFGVVTGRRRRCGWLDLVSLKYSVRVNSLTELFITKLDVLSGLEELQLCIGYNTENKVITDYPYELTTLDRAEPVYETFGGWSDDISSIKNYEDLPENAKTYLKAIEDFIEVPITFISVGPERTENIII